ncbi:DUF1731 domain-containing protein [Solirubrobacter phytolaccae]|uniref:DUF1731 domain-containing protein n=1 Tax=Solirubrobacter phytolaccae TaxID=1404360 RepID=A0A9X3S6W0_9ACTN|nr:DUF1731 domain-containing protein [Solirubrobacter phytolaccae]MDA0179598.1 DUF1731 domain-containing protein [Solirubrobacter phytolaccae]
MKIVLAGGTGQVGHVLKREFAGDEVVVIARSEGVRWDGRTLGAWVEALEGADALINLAGRTVDCRYTPANRRAIMRSRLESTWALRDALRGCAAPPRVWLQSSTATIYADNYGPAWDESGRLGGDEVGVPDTWRFSIDVAKRWEEAAADAPVRTVLMRTAMVMSPDRDGVFDTLYGLARRGLGGPAAGGRQYVSWIHDVDFARAVRRLIEDESFAGPVNLSSPNPVPYGDFMRVLRDGRVGLPATKWMLEVGAFFMRTETELVLKSRRVVPGRLLESGFAFAFPEWEAAARDLVSRRA